MGVRRYDGQPEGLLESMQLIRSYEERAAALQAETGVPGTCTAVGQEASAVGVVAALREDDVILTNHRSAGHLLARGADPGRLFAETMGRRDGYCKGRSGSLHVSVKELGVILTSTIVGGSLSLATGAALSQRMLGRTGIVVCFFGDGAACEGIFHESLNLASVWNLPILYVCENNQWQAFVHRRETMLTEEIREWAAPYGMPTEAVDGNDVEAVFRAAFHATDTIRATGRPYMIETHTYRLRGHFEPDDQAYVDAPELEAWKARDPLVSMKRRLLDAGRMSARDIEALEDRARKRVEEAVAFAAGSPFPSMDEITADVYA